MRSKKKSIDVSFLILNYNGKRLLKIILDSIKRIEFHGRYDVIVVDNHSTDGSREFMMKNYPYVKIIENRENLATSGINPGLRHCSGKYIFYLNNDIELGNDCLQILYDILEKNPDAGLVAPRHVNYYDRNLQSGGFWISRSFYAGHIQAGNHIDKTVREVPYAGVFLFRKDVTDILGYLFDPDYFIYSEDLDFSLRARLVGYKILFAPNAVIYHMHAATIGRLDNSRLTFLIERNTLSTFFKVMSLRNIILLLPYVFLMRIAALARDAVTFNFRTFAARLRAFAWVASHSGLIVKKRRQLQKLRKADDSEILGLFSERYIFKKQVAV